MFANACQERERQFDNRMEWGPDAENLVRKFARSWARKFRFSREDAEDMEQDAVVLAFSRVKAGRIAGREGLWILVRNSCFDAWGKGRFATKELKDEMIGASPEPGLGGVFVEQVAEVFPDLVVWAQARADGYSWDEISEAFGVPCGTMRVQWSRMAARAREKFGEELAEVLRA